MPHIKEAHALASGIEHYQYITAGQNQQAASLACRATPYATNAMEGRGSAERQNANDMLASIILPAYNEAEALPEVLQSLFTVLNERCEVIVVDDGSTDGTASIAEDYPCRIVLHSRNQGKGAAVRTGLTTARGRFIIVMDADNTYPPQAIACILAIADQHDFIRCERVEGRSNIPWANRIGNRLVDYILKLVHGLEGRDHLSGLYGLRREAFEALHFTADGFDLEVEIGIKARAHQLRSASLPISYNQRHGTTKLHPWRDGWYILYRIAKLSLLYHPRRALLLLGMIGWMLATVLAFILGWEWAIMPQGAAWLFGCLVPPVSIIVVNYNGMAHVGECLGSLVQRGCGRYRIILVDNHSTDGSLDFIRRHFPDVEIIASEQNLGYAGAVNLALAQIDSQYVAVLNMDTVVQPGWLEPLVAFLEAHPNVGAVAPQILLYDDPQRINSLGQHLHITGLGFNRGYNRASSGLDTRPTQVGGIHGAVFVTRRDTLERMGGMNTACFMYHEDVDFSWLIRLMGYDIYCVPTSLVRHKYVLSMNPSKLYFLERNRLAMLLANLNWTTILTIAPLLIFTELMMVCYCLKHGWRFVKAKARSVLWILRHAHAIRCRRSHVQMLRLRTDWQIMAWLRLNYEWDQLFRLAWKAQPTTPVKHG